MKLPPLETARLALRRTREADGEKCLEIWLDEEMGKYMADPPRDKADEGTLRFAQGIDEDESWHPMVAFHRQSGDFVGTCSVVMKEEGACWDVGYAIHQKYWRKGYATEMLHRIITLGREMGATAFTARVAQENIPSCALLRSLGFRVVKDTERYKKRGTDIIYSAYTFRLDGW